MSKQVTCSCGAYYFATFWIYGYFDYQTRANYCATCGDKLNADGTVESRAEVERKAKLFEDMFYAEEYIEKCDTCKNIEDEDRCSSCLYYSNYEEAAE